MKKYLFFFIVVLFLPRIMIAAEEPSQEMLDLQTQGLAQIIQGDAAQLKNINALKIVSVSTANRLSRVVFKNSEDARTITLLINSAVLSNHSLSVDQIINVAHSSTGYLLTLGNYPLTFIPNSTGQSLIHSHSYN